MRLSAQERRIIGHHLHQGMLFIHAISESQFLLKGYKFSGQLYPTQFAANPLVDRVFWPYDPHVFRLCIISNPYFGTDMLINSFLLVFFQMITNEPKSACVAGA